MEIKIFSNGQDIKVCLIGELDTATTTEHADELNKVLAQAGGALEIDCSELEYISSAGLRFFMQLRRASEAEGGSIHITHLNEDVAEIFRISGFQSIFEID